MIRTRTRPERTRWGSPSPFRLVATFAMLVMLGGCLPYSCQREEPRALTPSDSLSRQVAGTVPVDTLRRGPQSTGTADHPLQYPRTVRYGAGGRIFVSDVERHSVFVFGGDGRFAREITHEALRYPYLAGVRGDTVLVFNPEARQIHFLVGGRVVREMATPPELPEQALQYVTAGDTAVYFKAIGDGMESFIAPLAGGTDQHRVALPRPYWRHAGLLRVWGDSVLSLSAYRPVVDVLRPGGRLDTMALVGFDSPMLARSRAFLRGDVHEPPLLIPAADPAGPYLFVLNVRPGWLHVDVFDRGGRLQRRLVQEQPAYHREYYPIDLAVRRAEGRYELAVLITEPEARLDRYTWTPP